MKYKVGDRVKIRTDLEAGRSYYNEDGEATDAVTGDMLRFAGKLVTIEKITPYDKYIVEEDDEDWSWVDGMFECKATDSADDNTVSHPSHYTQGKIEVRDFINDKNLDFNRGNVVKYVVRAGHKPEGDKVKELEDLKKAQNYLNDSIQRIKMEQA